MKENKCCGNSSSSYAKDMDSFCVREFLHKLEVCNEDSDHHTRIINVWTEITPDNVEELYDKPIAVAWKYEGKTYYSLAGDCTISLATMAKHGGYYYYVLPELKKEE